MRAIVFALLTALTLSTSYAQTVHTPPLQCVRVRSEDEKGASLGTGALIASRYVATANHVVADRKNDEAITITFPNGVEVDGVVELADKDQDVAFIRIVPGDAKVPPPLKLFTGELQVGDVLWIMGYGSGPYKAQVGTLNDMEYSHGYREIDGAGARSGDSGGPVLDEQGRFAGILWGSSGETTMFSPSNIVIELFKTVYPAPISPEPLPYNIRGN